MTWIGWHYTDRQQLSPKHHAWPRWCRRRGCKRTTQNLWFGENPGKICGNLGKMSPNRCMCFDFTKMAPKIKVQTVFWRSCFYLFFFGQVRENLGKNPSHPQKFTCSYTHALTNIPPPTCPKSNQLDHQLRHPVLWFRHHRKLTIRTKTSVKTTWTLFSNWYLQNKSFRARVIQPRTGLC